jgi:cholera toxin transcriptional activator
MGDAGGRRRYRFGEFELDLDGRELRRNGARVRLQDQPFEILAMLVERAGHLVSRRDLQQRLWPDTYVDADAGLNTAMNKLREALGDEAARPRYIETVKRHGFKFIAAVEDAAARPAAAAGAAAAGGGAGADELPRPHRSVLRVQFGLLQAMYLAFYGVFLLRADEAERLAEQVFGGWYAAVMPALMVTAALGIAVRLFLLTAVWFDYRRLGGAFRRLFPFVFLIDEVWVLAPFLVAQEWMPGPASQLGFGLLCAAMLAYAPFAQRTLVRMGYEER